MVLNLYFEVLLTGVLQHNDTGSYISRTKNHISHRLLIVMLVVRICGSQKIFEVSVVPSPTTWSGSQESPKYRSGFPRIVGVQAKGAQGSKVSG